MATVNLGRIKPVWKNEWTASTSYVADDIVRSGTASYICVNAHTSGATFAVGSDWELMAAGGVDGTDGTTVGTGTTGQVLQTDSAGTGVEWADAEGGGLILLASATASDAADFQITTGDNLINNDYDCYVIDLVDCSTNHHNEYIIMRFGYTSDGTNTIWSTTGYKNSGSNIVFTSNQASRNSGDAPNAKFNMSIKLWNAAQSGHTHVSFSGCGVRYHDGDSVGMFGGQYYNHTRVLSGLSISCANGQISGKMNLYGIKKG